MSAVAGAAVVVGIDGSPLSLDAVRVAAAEAALRHRPLHIVYALAWPTLTAEVPPGVVKPALQAASEQAEAFVTEAVRLATKAAPEVRTTSRVVTGGAVPVLLAASRHADLLVVGERGAGGFSGLIVGSVAIQAATHGACPVLVVRGGIRPAGPVVVGVDGSRTSALALDFAVEEAALRGAELIALHAWTGGSSTELNDALPMSYENWSGEGQEQRVLAEALAGIGERYPDVPIRREVVNGSARRLLTDRSRTAQLVVVGDRGHGGFTGLLLGSVSQHLVYHAACPTVVVRQSLLEAPPTG
jgi:nucleotide-binding universal stress UspA family protein